MSSDAVILEQAITFNGFSLTQSHVPSQYWFQDLYASYAKFLDVLSTDRVLRDAFDKASSDFSSSLGDSWNSIPFGVVDRTIRVDKHDKIYLQWSRDYNEFLEKSGLLIPCLESLQSKLTLLHDLLQEFAEDVVSKLIPDFGFAKGGVQYPIVVKLVKYISTNSNRWATNPHQDKSIWSWILDSSDEECSLLIGPHTEELNLSNLAVPESWLPRRKWATKPAIEFPGLMANLSGLAMRASPHCVKPLKDGTIRYACIAFLILPNLGLFNAQTDVPYIDDIQFGAVI